MYEKICRRHRLSGNVKGFNGERLYGAMNMWADTLPNNSFTSCKLLIDVQEHRYHPYRFRSTNRIQKTVSYTVSKARSEKISVHQKSLWNNKNSLWKPETDRADRERERPDGNPRATCSGRRAGTTKHKKKVPGAEARREPPTCECGGALLSHTLSSAVPSPCQALASGFGKGPGVSPGP